MRETLETMIQVEKLKNEGLSNIAIARNLGIHRETVASYLSRVEKARLEGRPIEDLAVKRTRASIVESFLNYMQQRLNEYPSLTAKRLYKEIRKQGYKGSYRTVRLRKQRDAGMRACPLAWVCSSKRLTLGFKRPRRKLTTRCLEA